MNSAMYSAAASIIIAMILVGMSSGAPVQRMSKARLLSISTGFYVQSKPELSANAGDLTADESTQFVVDFAGDGLVTIRRLTELSQFLSVQETEHSGLVGYTLEESGSGSALMPQLSSHIHFEYHYERSVYSTVLRVRHSNGRYCYLAFEENGRLVEDPCSENLDLYKARVMLVAIRE